MVSLRALSLLLFAILKNSEYDRNNVNYL